MAAKLIFLPGASGNTEFWLPVSRLLGHSERHVHFGWPGFGQTPADQRIQSLSDLVESVVSAIDEPSALVAQSMGGVVAILAAIRKSELVTHLVLSALSGGFNAESLGAKDWRPPKNEITSAPEHLFAAYTGDLTAQLKGLRAKTLLLWSDADPISPVAVGKHAASLIQQSELHVLPGGGHTFANTQPEAVAALINAHLHPAA